MKLADRVGSSIPWSKANSEDPLVKIVRLKSNYTDCVRVRIIHVTAPILSLFLPRCAPFSAHRLSLFWSGFSDAVVIVTKTKKTREM